MNALRLVAQAINLGDLHCLLRCAVDNLDMALACRTLSRADSAQIRYQRVIDSDQHTKQTANRPGCH